MSFADKKFDKFHYGTKIATNVIKMCKVSQNHMKISKFKEKCNRKLLKKNKPLP